MYKILVVDDEDHLRNLIVDQVDWAALGFSVASARDGREALAVAETFLPDALLTDIRMPFINGLELIQLLKERFPDLVAVVLSGHDEFGYAKDSLKMGVTDYLLKPIRPQMLAATMREIKNKLDEMAERRDENARIRLQLEESMPFLRQQYLSIIVLESYPEEMIRQQFGYLGIGLSGSCYAVSVLSYDSPHSPADKFFTRFAVQSILQKNLPDACCYFDNAGIHYILSALGGEAEDRAALLCALEQSVAEVKDQLSLTATAAAGTDVFSLANLPQSCKSAVAALDSQVIDGRGKVYDAAGFFPAEETKFDFPFQLAADTISKLPYEQDAAFAHNLDVFFRQVRAQSCTDVTYLHIVFADIINNSHKLLSEYGTGAPTVSGDIYHLLFSLTTLEEMEQLVGGYLAGLKEHIDSENKQQQQSLTEQAHEYAAAHYSDPSLSLSGLAQRFYVSSSYLSNLFKRGCGMNFVEYVTKLRMDKARELLASSELKTYEIAERVGYNDPQYFSNSFKKYTGQTPSEFRSGAKG